jgi:hypothetical protein
MNALKNLRSVVLVGSIVVVALGSSARLAEAHGSGIYGFRTNSVYCNTLHYYPSTSLYSGYYAPQPYFSTGYTWSRPVSYPTTLYDGYGRPYVVWQTSYSAYLR